MTEIGTKLRNTRGTQSAKASTPVVPGTVSLEFQTIDRPLDKFATTQFSEYDARVLRDTGVFVCGASRAVMYGR